MEKKRSERLSIVVRMAQTESNDAASVYETSRDLLDSEKQKLQSLNDYYNDYSNPILPGACNVEKIARQSSFLGQIYEARMQQERVVNQQTEIVERCQIDWQKKNLKYKALLEMVERIVVDENKQLSRKEEKLLDDWYLQSRSVQQDQWR